MTDDIPGDNEEKTRKDEEWLVRQSEDILPSNKIIEAAKKAPLVGPEKDLLDAIKGKANDDWNKQKTSKISFFNRPPEAVRAIRSIVNSRSSDREKLYEILEVAADHAKRSKGEEQKFLINIIQAVSKSTVTDNKGNIAVHECAAVRTKLKNGEHLTNSSPYATKAISDSITKPKDSVLKKAANKLLGKKEDQHRQSGPR
ncbi:MAG TPA: hypothetical protein VLI69_09305 [Gammaproteobacteria bacterium]|nr:hypothetical protein [Gammaproteobacteria bacterium]